MLTLQGVVHSIIHLQSSFKENETPQVSYKVNLCPSSLYNFHQAVGLRHRFKMVMFHIEHIHVLSLVYLT